MRHTGAKDMWAAVGVLAVALSGSATAMDHSHHMHMVEEGGSTSPGRVHVALPDTVLTDQNGKALRFTSDALGGRLVAINFIYTTCTTVCPLQSALFAGVQKQLGERLGKEVVLVSVTVDPLRDTPLVLKQFASRYRARPGWTFLTGGTQAVEEVLRAFDVYIANFDDHPATTLVGDPGTDDWTRFLGFPSAEQIVTRLDALQSARASARSARAR